MTACLILTSALLAGQEQRPSPPPLTEAQRERLVELVRITRKRAEDIKEKLTKRQNELTGLYADFDLKLSQVQKVQAEVLALQKELLHNYHHMQVELRSIVGRERFLTLQKRLARVLGVEGPKK